MAKPSIVFLPGAWHTAECFDALTPYLKEVGYDTYPLTLPSVSEPDPIRSLDPEIEHVHKTIIPLIEDGQDVIIVCHSYGGVPGSSSVKGLSKKDRAAQGKLGGVSAMVYICSWMIEEGQTIRGCGGGKGGKLGPAKLHIENEQSLHLDPVPAMYHDLPPDVGERYAKLLRPFSLITLDTPCRYSAHRFIPTTYIHATGDLMIAYERQLELIKTAGVPITTFTVDASHSPFASQPEWTSRVIRHAAGEEIEVGKP